MRVQPIKEATARIVGEIVPSRPDAVVHTIFVRTFAASGGALLLSDRYQALGLDGMLAQGSWLGPAAADYSI
jgi:hypothetical protein